MGQLINPPKAGRFIIAVLILSLVAEMGFSQTPERKIAAILIGNHAYHSINLPPLAFPNNDVEKVKTLCQELKFDTVITTSEKKTRKEFFDDIALYKKLIFEKRHITDLVIYYSGHGGSYEGGESFLIPTDFEPLQILPLYTSSSEAKRDITIYLSDLDTNTNRTPHEAEFRKRLGYFNLIKNAASVAMLCDSLKQYNLLFISDACRTRFVNSTKGFSDVTGPPIDDKAFVGPWLKKHLHDSKDREDQFITDFRDFKNYVNATIKDFDARCAYFNKTLSDPGVRKPVTVLYGTNFYNSATELSSLFSGVFTQCFIQSVKESRSSPIVLDDNFISNVTRCINTDQKPILEGVRSFGFTNPFIKSQIINAASIAKTITNKSFKAVRITLSNTTQKHLDLLTRTTSVMRKYDQKELKQLPEFAHFFADTSLSQIPVFFVEARVRLPELSLAFEDNKMSLSFYEESIVSGGNDYTFNKQNQTFSQGQGGISISNVSNRTTKTETDQVDGEYSIISDSAISLKRSLLIPHVLNCDIMTVKKISANFDTLEVEVPDISTAVTLNLQLVVSNGSKKEYAGADIPYSGELTANKTKVVSKFNFAKGNIFFPTNTIFNNNWKNGKYKCVIWLKVKMDSLRAADTAITNRLRNDFLTVQVNNVSNCDDPVSPVANSQECFKTLAEFKYGMEVFQQSTNYIPLTLSFDIVDANPSQLKLSIPFFCPEVKNCIKDVDVESITVDCVKVYSEAYVNQKLNSATPVNGVHQ
ncbi:MAG: caspase family protein [Mucilaginibacter sp.]